MTREKASVIIGNIPIEGDNCYTIAEYQEAKAMAIQALEQQPKIGYWITSGEYYTGAYESINYVNCSCCHVDSLEEGNYCPNCGAKMEEL